MGCKCETRQTIQFSGFKSATPPAHFKENVKENKTDSEIAEGWQAIVTFYKRPEVFPLDRIDFSNPDRAFVQLQFTGFVSV